MKTTIIAEIASNWKGSLSIAQKLIYESKMAGADVVKFQLWRAKDLYSEVHPYWNFIKKAELTFDQIKKLKKIADQVKIEFMCSIFYPEGVNYLESLSVKRYKIASRTCILKDPLSIETLQKVAQTRKPVIISMGMGGNKKNIEKIFSMNKKTFCYCISEYPLEFNKIYWNKAVNYNGFSDHTVGITASIIFVALKKLQGAKHIIIEKHVKLKNSKGPDASSSIDTEQLSELVFHIRMIEKTNFKKLRIVNKTK